MFYERAKRMWLVQWKKPSNWRWRVRWDNLVSRWLDFSDWAFGPGPPGRGRYIKVPIFKVEANPTITLSEIKARRFYIVDRAQIKAKEAMQHEEDTRFMETVEKAASFTLPGNRSRWFELLEGMTS